MFCFSALVALAGALHSLPAEDAHHNIFRTSKRERERKHSFLARSPQQASICLPLRDQSTRSALCPWDLRAAWIRKWSSAKRHSAVCEVLGWMSSTAKRSRDTDDDKLDCLETLSYLTWTMTRLVSLMPVRLPVMQVVENDCWLQTTWYIL